MKKTLLCCSFLGLMTFSGSLISAQDSPPAPTSGLAKVLQPYVDTHVAAGLVVLVADKDKVLDIQALGYASVKNKAPMKADALFWIASMTKPITATALMMLVDEGKVKVDDPVEKYLPKFKGQMVVDEKDATHTPVPARHPITIKEILTHTSGMIQEKDLPKQQSEAMDYLDLKKVTADYAAAPLKHQPGTICEYNNSGINTAGRIIEVVSGMSYADFVQKRLFDPLGMKDTTFWPNQEQAARLAHSFKFNADKTNLEEIDYYGENKAGIDGLAVRIVGGTNVVPTSIIADMGHGQIFSYNKHYAMPAGGLFSTAGDLAQFCRMLLNGGTYQGKRYLSEAAIKQMTSMQTENISPNPNRGLGWEVKPDSKGVPGAGTYAHTGARRTRMWVDPTNQLVMILLMERMDLPGKDENNLYTTFLKTALEKYGKATGTH